MSDDMIHELWVAAQLAPNEGIEDAVERMSTICGEVIDWKARLEKAVGLLKEVRQWHSDPSLPEYNHCDTAPCHFCEQAAEIILDGK